MAGINDLPRETLHSVISYLNTGYGDLLNCSLVCWSWWDVATAALYHNIDLRNGRDNDANSTVEHTSRKQMILLKSLAEYIHPFPSSRLQLINISEILN